MYDSFTIYRNCDESLTVVMARPCLALKDAVVYNIVIGMGLQAINPNHGWFCNDLYTRA